MPNGTEYHRFNIGWSSQEITKELQARLDEAQKFLMSEPIRPSYLGKKTNSWKPINRGKRCK